MQKRAQRVERFPLLPAPPDHGTAPSEEAEIDGGMVRRSLCSVGSRTRPFAAAELYKNNFARRGLLPGLARWKKLAILPKHGVSIVRSCFLIRHLGDPPTNRLGDLFCSCIGPGSSQMRRMAITYFAYSEQEFRRTAARPPSVDTQSVGHHRKWNELSSRQLIGEFGHCARHMEVSGDNDE